MKVYMKATAVVTLGLSMTARLQRVLSFAPSPRVSSLLAKRSRVFYSAASEESIATGGTATATAPKFPLAGKSIDEISPRLRFAPSPTGSLHVGGARTALYNWLMAKKGQMDFPQSEAGFIIRVEDTDLARSTKESERSVLADLQWLGLKWDEGPDDELAKYGPYRQSERSDYYKELADQLINDGKAYPCFCTNEEIEEMKAQQEAQGLSPRYDGRWRDADPALVKQKMEEGVPYTIRFKVPQGSRIVIDDVVRGTVSWDAEATVGDFILLRSNGVPVYNFCVAVDDAMMGISTVIRAEEHLTNTLRQALILDALEAPRPQYAHCSLILGEDKQKLSKRHGATSCNQFRLDGFLPDAMINYLALLGWNDGTDNELFSRDELIDAFEIERVVKSPSVFDMTKLKWINSQHLKKLSVEDLLDLVKEQMDLEGMLADGVSVDDQATTDLSYAATSLAKQMMETTKDAVTNAKTVLEFALPESFDKIQDPAAQEIVKQGHFYQLASKIVAQVEAGEFPLPDPQNPLASFGEDVEKPQKGSFISAYKAYMKSLAKEYGVKGKNLFHPVRYALTGEMSGQDVTRQLALLEVASAHPDLINTDTVAIVKFNDRIQRLKSFLDTIPEEFRAPKTEQEKAQQKAMDQQADAEKEAASANVATVADPKDSYDGPPISALDIRVGRINKVWVHEEAEKLYCEEIDVGEDEPRLIASGLRPFMKEEDMEGRMCLVLCNLKTRKMVGFPSHGMVICASDEEHSNVKFINPPIDAKIGERVTIPDFDFESAEAAPYAENKVGKKKVVEKILPHLKTNKYGIPEFLGRPFMTSAGVCTSSIPEGTVG